MSNFKQTAIEAILEKVKNKMSEVLTPEEMNQITVRWLTNKSDELSFHLSGPHEIINKIRKITNDLGFTKGPL